MIFYRNNQHVMHQKDSMSIIFPWMVIEWCIDFHPSYWPEEPEKLFIQCTFYLNKSWLAGFSYSGPRFESYLHEIKESIDSQGNLNCLNGIRVEKFFFPVEFHLLWNEIIGNILLPLKIVIHFPWKDITVTNLPLMC